MGCRVPDRQGFNRTNCHTKEGTFTAEERKSPSERGATKKNLNRHFFRGILNEGREPTYFEILHWYVHTVTVV